MKPAPTVSLCAGRYAGGSADDATKAAAEIVHAVNPLLGIDSQPLENRAQVPRNRPALVGADLTPYPIEQGQVFAQPEGRNPRSG